ncbi:MAG: type II secretion system protein [Bacilli bacterium]|nr:type II secretion system protein [Bacilli bacterium]
MKKKGFTLVELLVMLIVLGVLMVVTIPNISGLLKNQRLNKWKNDSENLIEIAKNYISKNSSNSELEKPEVNKCVVFTLDYLDTNNEMKAGPNGGKYQDFDSFVVYKKESTGSNTSKWVYYVQLVEISTEGTAGLKLKVEADLEDLKKSDISNKTEDLILGLSDEEDSSTQSLESSLASVCPGGIKKYYARKK